MLSTTTVTEEIKQPRARELQSDYHFISKHNVCLSWLGELFARTSYIHRSQTNGMVGNTAIIESRSDRY